VEQRLRIVKRNRTKGGDEALQITGIAPPLAHFPVFDVTRPSKADQQAVEAVVREVLDCLLFSDTSML
jgi:hypothetical protein